MESFKIEIEGQQFTSNYLVYVVIINSSEYGKLYYVGQTGDRNHLTARPAFRRLAAHFDDQGRSTQNQIYRAIAVQILGIKDAKSNKIVFDKDTKIKVASMLSKSKIQMNVFPVAKFENETTKEEHDINRKFSEKIEDELMSYMIQNGFTLLNLRLPKTFKSIFDSTTLKIIQDMDFNQI